MSQMPATGKTFSVFLSYSHREKKDLWAALRDIFVGPDEPFLIMRASTHSMVNAFELRGSSRLSAPSLRVDKNDHSTYDCATLLQALASPGYLLPTAQKAIWDRLKDSCACNLQPRALHNLASQVDAAYKNDFFVWTEENYLGFLINRILSYPQSDLLRFGEGLVLLGGLIPAFELAWETLFKTLRLQVKEGALGIEISERDSLLDWATLLASWNDCEVEVDDERNLDACLIETREHLAIHLSDHLEPKAKAYSILHELAHLILGHTANTQYGVDPDWLTIEALSMFQSQEKTADTLASLWSYILEGINDITSAIYENSYQDNHAGEVLLDPIDKWVGDVSGVIEESELRWGKARRSSV